MKPVPLVTTQTTDRPAPADGLAAARRPSPAGRPAATATVAILGLGYVGLPTALAFAAAGVRVLGIDVSERRLADIATGDVDLLDSDHSRLASHLGAELTCSADAAALRDADAVIVCVPTPVDEEFNPDLRPLRGACTTLLEHVRAGQLLVLTSTSYVGTTRDMLVDPLRERGMTPGEDIFVAFAPERIDPGNTVHPQETVPRVVGGVTEACAARAEEILSSVAPIHRVSSAEAAELTKLHENTFRAVNIAYSYELAQAAAHYGVDAREVIDAASSKPFGFMPFYPGAGVGGHCIPCDPHYLLKPLAEEGVESPIVRASMNAIALRPHQVVDRALQLVVDEKGMDARDARILVVGAAYKPGVADMRESPAVDIIHGLDDRGVNVDYTDALVPTLDVNGMPMVSVTDPNAAAYDLVVLACVHPGTRPFWEDALTPVLDCTYRALTAGDVRRIVL